MGNTCSKTSTPENNLLRRQYHLVDNCTPSFLLYWGVSLNGHNQTGCVHFYNEFKLKIRVLLFSIPATAGEVSSVIFSIENGAAMLTFNTNESKTFLLSWASDECLFFDGNLTNVSPTTVIFNEDGSTNSVSKVNKPSSEVIDSHDDGSATPDSEFFESNAVLALLNHTVSQRFAMSALQTASIFLQSGIVSASETLLPVLQSGIVSASETLLPVLQNDCIVLEVNFCLGNSVTCAGTFAIPIGVMEEMIDFFRAVSPDVLATVSDCIQQLGGLLVLGYEHSKTALVVSDEFCDNGCQFASKMFDQIQLFISWMMQQILSKQSESTVPQNDWSEEEDPTGWLFVNWPEPSALDLVSSNCSRACTLKSAEEYFDVIGCDNAMSRSSESRSGSFADDLSFEERIRQLVMTYGINENLLRETIIPCVSGGSNFEIKDVSQCGPQIDESAHALEVVHRKVLRQSGIVSASHSPATVIRINQCIVFLARVCVDDVNLLVRIPIRRGVIESMIKFFRAVGPDVLGTVSRLINQLVGLLQLDYKPSKTALVLSDAVCDNGRNFLTSMFHQMRRNISLLERRASSEDATGWEIVECVKHVAPRVEVVSSNRSASSALDLVSSESPEQLYSRQDFDTETKITGVNVVNFFSDKKHKYTVCPDRIEYSIGHDTFSVNFGISFAAIQKMVVYEIEKFLFLIVIHTFDRQVYLSGHSGTSTSPIFVKAQITTHVSVGQPNLFKSIEFDSSNSLHFHINMTNCKKFFSIDNQDGSIRQLSCQWKKL